VLEAVAQRPPLAGGVFQQHHRPASRPRPERQPDGIGDQPQRVGFSARRARAGVNDDAEQAQRVGALELVEEGVERLLAQLREGRRQVDQVTRVRHDGRDAGLVEAAAERSDVGRIERLSAPLAAVLAEYLQRLTAVHDGALDGVRDAAGDRHMRADA
jgi:hypothetical protein